MSTIQSDLESTYAATFDPRTRKKWDAMVKDVNLLSIQDCDPKLGKLLFKKTTNAFKRKGDGLAVSHITTNPAAGGLVKSRMMLDLALQKTCNNGGIKIINCSCPAEFEESKVSVKAIMH